MRRALRSLGMTELFPDPALPSHEDLESDLKHWADSGAGPGADTLVVYCTGHGVSGTRGGLVLGDGRHFGPDRLVKALEERRDLQELVLIIDACFAETGAAAAAHEVHVPHTRTAGLSFWVIAASRRVQEAAPKAFARAFETALQDLMRPSWTQRCLDPGQLSAAVDARLPRTQKVWLAGGHPPTPCRALPNPHYQRRDVRDIALPLDLDWSARARGVARAAEPGFFFTGRRGELRRLRGLVDGGARVAVVTGGPGSGKSAMLGHLVLTSTPASRAVLPAVALHDVPQPTAVVVTGRGTPTDVLRSLARGLPAAPDADVDQVLRALQDVRGAVLVVLDQLDETDPAPWEYLLAGLGQTPEVRTVVALPRDTRISLRVPYPVLDLDRSRGTDLAVRDYLRLRVVLDRPSAPAREVDQTTDHLAELCHHRFDVAVAVADQLGRDTPARGMPGADRAGDAAATAALRIGSDIVAGVLGHRAPAVVEAVAALCSYNRSIALPHAEWAAAASDPAGAVVSPSDVALAAPRLVPLVQESAAADGSPRWRWIFGYPSDAAIQRERFVARLPQLCSGPPDSGEAPDPALLMLLARAAAVRTARGRWVDDPAFLLGGAPTLVQAAVRALPGDESDRARRSRLLRSSRVSGSSAADRAFLLGIDARRYGVQPVADALSASAAADGVRIVWCHPERAIGSGVVDVAMTPGPPAVAVTLHEDGEVAFWSVPDGTPVRSPVRVPGATANLAIATVDGVATAVVASARREIWSVSGRSADPVLELRLEPSGTSRAAPRVAVHPAGHLVLGSGIDVLVADRRQGREPRVLASLDSEVVDVRAAGPPGAPIVWAFSASGRIRRLPLGREAGADPAVFPVPGRPLKVAVTRDGTRAVVMDAGGAVHVRSIDGTDGTLPGRRPPTVQALAGEGDLALIAGGSVGDLGWWEAVAVGDVAPPQRRVVDQPPIGVALVGDGTVLLARPAGLLLVALPRPAATAGGVP